MSRRWNLLWQYLSSWYRINYPYLGFQKFLFIVKMMMKLEDLVISVERIRLHLADTNYSCHFVILFCYKYFPFFFAFLSIYIYINKLESKTWYRDIEVFVFSNSNTTLLYSSDFSFSFSFFVNLVNHITCRVICYVRVEKDKV